MTKPTTIFKRWVEREAIGDDFTYHTAGQEPSVELFEYAHKLSDAGLVLLWQRRTPDGNGFDHVARRITQAAARFIDATSASVNHRPERQPRRELYNGPCGLPVPGREFCLDYAGD